MHLKAFRRARGLWDHCGEKWNCDYKCAAQVGLNVLDELYPLFFDEVPADNPPTEDDNEHVPKESCNTIASYCVPTLGIRTLQFQGKFQDIRIMLLLDSRSSVAEPSK